MAGFYSGKEGELLIDGTKVAKVRSFSFSFNQAVLETVSLEDTDRTIFMEPEVIQVVPACIITKQLLGLILASLVH